MTQNEREELIFDIAQQRVGQLSHAGIFAMAVDQMCGLLKQEPEEELLKLSTRFIKPKNKTKKVTGF
tara:strand:+ start:177 stop:377 length:201 start_codon:yes stop_codon:yes gene_type:complete